jgi:hypothetical protein
MNEPPKHSYNLAFKYFDFDVPEEDYSRNASCALNVISTFLFLIPHQSYLQKV